MEAFTVCLSTQVFPCLLTSDLPVGVVEVPQVSVEVQRRDGIVSGGLLLLGDQPVTQAASLMFRMWWVASASAPSTGVPPSTAQQSMSWTLWWIQRKVWKQGPF